MKTTVESDLGNMSHIIGAIRTLYEFRTLNNN